MGTQRLGRVVLAYFGLMSHPCLEMFSELRVDSGKSNHYIVPQRCSSTLFIQTPLWLRRSLLNT